MSSNKLILDGNMMLTREEIVADAIRKAILRGTFKPGEKLDQQELADSLGVSRSPVREALRTLAAEDLVTNIPHRGATVTQRSKDELQELLFMRLLLEGAAIQRAVPALQPTHLHRLEDIIAKAKQTSEYEELLQLNNDFHKTIYSAFKQPYLIDVIQSMRNKVAPYNRIYLDVPKGKEKAWADHVRIYDACAQGNEKQAKKETENHLERVFHDIMSTME
jgi:DNA-binding GntR family transcriptional regulator